MELNTRFHNFVNNAHYPRKHNAHSTDLNPSRHGKQYVCAGYERLKKIPYTNPRRKLKWCVVQLIFPVLFAAVVQLIFPVLFAAVVQLIFPVLFAAVPVCAVSTRCYPTMCSHHTELAFSAPWQSPGAAKSTAFLRSSMVWRCLCCTRELERLLHGTVVSHILGE